VLPFRWVRRIYSLITPKSPCCVSPPSLFAPFYLPPILSRNSQPNSNMQTPHIFFFLSQHLFVASSPFYLFTSSYGHRPRAFFWLAVRQSNYYSSQIIIYHPDVPPQLIPLPFALTSGHSQISIPISAFTTTPAIKSSVYTLNPAGSIHSALQIPS
jgi:hypothetical protein